MTRHPSVAILTYHSLDETGSVISTSPAQFALQMRNLAESGARVVSLDEAWKATRDGTPQGSPVVAITFDDGFRNFREHAQPVLRRYRLPATVFLVSDFVGADNGWPGQPGFIPRLPLMGWDEIRELASEGVEFGCHTRTHPDLAQLSRAEVEAELDLSREAIRSVTGKACTSFAYPYGTYTDDVVAAAAERFPLACSAQLGYAGPASEPHTLERLDTYYLRDLRAFTDLFAPSLVRKLAFRRTARSIRRLLTARPTTRSRTKV